MKAIHHVVDVDATLEALFNAITTELGLLVTTAGESRLCRDVR